MSPVVRHILVSRPSRIDLAFTSRTRKIRCDGAKPKCFHCTQREGNNECTYDALPKRRGPDKVQGARTRGTRPQGEDPPRRRRRRRSTTVDQAASGSYDIIQPSVTVKHSKLDTSEVPIFLVDPQQYGVRIHESDPGLEHLESSTVLSTTTSHSQLLEVEPTITGYAVSGLFMLV